MNDDSPQGDAKDILPGQTAKERTPPADPAGTAPPAPPPPAPAPGGGVADHLTRTRRHPIIVFGIGASGKTTILMSLVQAINRSGDVNVFLGEPILPASHPDSATVHEEAIKFFERDAQGFAMGQMVPPTTFERPYFIPLDIERKSDGRIVRLAFLEGQGEWYKPIKEGRGSMFPHFQRDIADIMSFYGESLSIFWVAPFSVGEGQDFDTADSDLALVGALNEYRKHRRSVSQDFHLFLLNKWDCYAEPLADSPLFSNVSAQIVESIINDRYQYSWPNYKALALNSTGRRFFMQYTSGHIINHLVAPPPQRHRAAFDRYPRTLLNWLYGNATESEVDVEGRRSRFTLFQDVLARPPRRRSIFEKIASIILAR